MATLYGVRVKDANGNITFDPTMRAGRILGFVDVSDNGSLSHSGFLQGSGFYFVLPFSASGVVGVAPYPTCNFSGSVMTWTYNTIPNFSGKGPCRIFYGVY